MLTNARQKLIEEIALRDGEVIISKVSKELGVSIETIRRDINELCSQKILVKVHGGAIPADLPVQEAAYSKRKNTNSSVKKKLGAYAASLIKSGQIVSISTGSTMEAIASSIKDISGVTVLTNSLTVTDILSEKADSSQFDGKVILFGGQVNINEHYTYGVEVVEQVNHFYSNLSFICTGAISESSLMNTDIDESAVASKMIECSQRTILVMESNKIGKRSVYRFADLADIKEIITDDEYPVPDEILKAIQEKDIILHIIH